MTKTNAGIRSPGAAPAAKRSIIARLPLLRLVVQEWKLWRSERAKPRFRLAAAALAKSSPELPAYPIDMSPLLALPFGVLDAEGIPYNTTNGAYGGAYQPTSIAQYALAHLNAYIETRTEDHWEAFLTQARWLVAHEVRLTNGAGVWPIPFPTPSYGVYGPWLSALTQGNVVSVLVRAYQATGDDAFLGAAHRAIRAFTLDILDGGVAAPLGADGIYFEEVAAYPAARILNGYILALFGVFDYVALTGDASIQALADRSVATLHTLIGGYDLGYWSAYDLLHRRPASRFYHTLHVVLLRALAQQTGCQHCAALADRWSRYEDRLTCRARYYWSSRLMRYRSALAHRRRGRSAARSSGPARICVPITAFPVPGGMRGVLAGVAATMHGEWHMEYLTRRVGPNAEGLLVRPFEARLRLFGRETTSPSQFPNVWLYMSAGRRALKKLLRAGRRTDQGFDLLLPQDGAFTAAFTGSAARRAGIPIVIMDHGNVTLPFNPLYRQQRREALKTQRPLKRFLSRLRLSLYIPTLKILIRYATKRADRMLVAGDEVAEVYLQRFAVHPSRIVRYPYMVDIDRFALLEGAERRQVRDQLGIEPDAVVVTMVNRMAPEKGMDIALQGIARARGEHPDLLRRLQVIIVGDGPLRSSVEADVRHLGLQEVCTLWGVAAPDQVATLLGVSDLFLYTGTRGTNFSVAVLEAMAAGCAVVASTEPRSNACLLAEGRGAAIPPGRADAVADALVSVLSEPGRCQQMGSLARAYVADRHSADALRRSLRRATPWAPALEDLEVLGTPAQIPASTQVAGSVQRNA
jgi:glycosyltransferase involved in cell wall biosynthesis